MIQSATQLKAKIRNVSGGDSRIAMTMMRTFFMERFLERVSVSPYKESFVLKGGMLVSSMIGIMSRATMDIDASVRNLSINDANIGKIISEIGSIDLGDNITFAITSLETIMDEFDYPGVRIHIDGVLEKINQPIKIDISTDDVITPGAIDYNYELMFEKRAIGLMTYNVETLLAEKVQTILARGLANTRMRDFYDIYEITQIKEVSGNLFREAFGATCQKRETYFKKAQIENIVMTIENNDDMLLLWQQFQVKNYYVEEISFEKVIESVRNLLVYYDESYEGGQNGSIL